MNWLTTILDSMKARKNLSVALLLLVLTMLYLNQALLPPSGQVLGGGPDVQGLFIPWLTESRGAITSGRLPFWDSDQFAGYPFLSNPQVALFYPPTWLAILLPVRIGISWYVLFHIWAVASVGMWLFARRMGSHEMGAILAALAFGFSGFAAARIDAGHIGLLATNSWLPWILGATAWAVERKDRWSGIIAGVPFAMAILAGHTASLLYIVLAWAAFTVYQMIVTRQWRRVTRAVALAAITGLALSSIQLLPLLQLSRASTRVTDASFDFASAFSFPPAHLITFLMPEFFGEPTRAGYWSVPNFAELTYYVGVLPVLALLLTLRKVTRLSWFYIGLIIVGLLLAFGGYGFLFPLAYDLFPPFRIARAPGRAAVLFTFAASALLSEVITVWRRQPAVESPEILNPFLTRLMQLAAIVGFTALAATAAVFAAQHPTETSGRLWHQIGSWMRATVLVLIGLALLRAYLVQERGRWFTGISLMALMLVDLWTFGFKQIRLQPIRISPMWQDAQGILGDTSGRVLPWGVSIFDQNGAGQVGLSSVFGYNALELAPNTELAASVPDPRSTAFDILGAGAVVANVPLDQFTDGVRPLTLIEHTDSVWVYRRARTLPIARLAYQVEAIEEGSEAIGRVHQPDFDPAVTVILDQVPECALPLTSASAGTAQVIEQRDGFWRIHTSSLTPALLVLSESDYPGWSAEINGHQVPIYKAYNTIRAVCVPAGEQTVVWRFKPTVFIWGAAISLLTLMAIGVASIKVRRHG